MHERSNVWSLNGSSSADAFTTTTSGRRSRIAATNGSDGSTAMTDAAPSRSTSTSVSAPGPQPTSSAVRPRPTASQSANSTESGRENRPMKRSYDVAATLNDMPGF